MRRRLFTLAAGVSAVLCVAIIGLWAFSYVWCVYGVWSDTDLPAGAGARTYCRVSHTLRANHGVVVWTRTIQPWAVPPDPTFPRWRGVRLWDAGRWVGVDEWQYRPEFGPAGWSVLGFGVTRHQFTVETSDRAELPGQVRRVQAPMPLLAAGVGAFAFYFIYRTLRGRRHRAAGRCPACGYDLRATPDRCPECGAPAKGAT